MYPGMGQARPRFDHHQNGKQRNPQTRREIRADKLKRAQEIKAAYITKRLDLSPEQYQRFWPLYRQYQAEMLAAQLEKRALNSSIQPNSTEQLDKEYAIEQKILNIRRRYDIEYLKFLSPEKVVQIRKSEKEFNDEALKQLKEQKDDPNN